MRRGIYRKAHKTNFTKTKRSNMNNDFWDCVSEDVRKEYQQMYNIVVELPKREREIELLRRKRENL